MADFNKDRNVDDVLSSVRRLVSGELASAQRRRSVPQALVLTPRQRISEARPPLAAQSLEDRIAELEAQLAERQDEWEPDGSEDISTHRPTEPIILPVARVEDEDGEATAAAPRTLRRLSRIELVDDASETAEPQLDADAEEAAMEVPTSDTATPQADDAEGDMPEAEFDKALAETVAQSVNAVISEITATAAGEDEEPDADVTAAADFGPALDEVVAEVVKTEAAGDDEVEDATAPVQRAAPPAAHASAARLEGDLRDLVAGMIREELQGELGARITRNVRKLVRREIQRALAARDLS